MELVLRAKMAMRSSTRSPEGIMAKKLKKIELKCPCCPGAMPMMTIEQPAHIPLSVFLREWKKDAREGGHKPHCSNCGCAQRTVDDGKPVNEGGHIKLRNESTPRIDSVDAPAGGRVLIRGHALTTGSIQVLIGGVLANVVSKTPDQVLVRVPTAVEEGEADEADVAARNEFGMRPNGRSIVRKGWKRPPAE